MAPDPSEQDAPVARSIARRLLLSSGIGVLVVALLAASRGLLADGPSIALALVGAIAIAATGARVARVAAEELRAREIEIGRLNARASNVGATVDAERRRALNAMADTIERETGIVLARLAQQAKSRTGGLDVDDLLRQAREGVVRAVRGASGDVERRRWPRLRLAGTAEVQIAGAAVMAPIVDVSAGGIRIDRALAAVVGTTCRVRLPGVGPELPARILAVSASETRLAFDIDDITRAVVNRMLENVAREPAAAA